MPSISGGECRREYPERGPGAGRRGSGPGAGTGSRESGAGSGPGVGTGGRGRSRGPKVGQADSCDHMGGRGRPSSGAAAHRRQPAPRTLRTHRRTAKGSRKNNSASSRADSRPPDLPRGCLTNAGFRVYVRIPVPRLPFVIYRPRLCIGMKCRVRTNTCLVFVRDHALSGGQSLTKHYEEPRTGYVEPGVAEYGAGGGVVAAGFQPAGREGRRFRTLKYADRCRLADQSIGP